MKLRMLYLQPRSWRLVADEQDVYWHKRWRFSVYNPARTFGFARREELAGIFFECPRCERINAIIQRRNFSHVLLCREFGCWARYLIDKWMLGRISKKVLGMLSGSFTTSRRPSRPSVGAPPWLVSSPHGAPHPSDIWNTGTQPLVPITAPTWDFGPATSLLLAS